MTDEVRKRISKTLKGYGLGKKLSKETIGKIRMARLKQPDPRLGKLHSIESKLKISKNRMGKCIGEDHWNWKGNISEQAIKHRLRGLLSWKIWRKSVFERDDYRCIDCGERGVYLEPHHIIPLKQLIKTQTLGRVFDINNGITLCRPCHKKTMGKESELASTYFSLIGSSIM